MLTYKYVARDAASGKKVSSELQAENERAATKLIAKQGLTPIEISLAGDSKGPGKFFNKVKAKDKILFARQLSTLINAGLPLLQSLRTVNGQTQSKQLRVIINQIITDIEAGSALSVALAKHPGTFNQIFISLVAAGETSGTLDAALERIATQQEKDAEILSKVRGAMVYPVIVVLVMVMVIGFMIVKVLPQVQILYDGLGGNNQLPILTRVLLAVSHFVTTFWWAIILVLVLLGFFTTRWVRTLGGRSVVDKFKMKAPLLGPLFMKVYMARFSRTAQTLIASGVPLLQVLDITAQSINNVHIEGSIHRAAEKVKGGKALSETLSGDPNFLQLVPDMMRIGEQSGAMEAMTGKVADYFEKEVDQQIKTISTIIEPVLMVLLGVVAFIIVAAVLLPIYGLAGKSGLGG
jgi:type IV pilus assembly protein PilC